MKRIALVGLSSLLAIALPAIQAQAGALTISYYTVGEGDKDANRLAGGVFNNEVQSQLGPDGLPVLNTAAYGCTTNCVSGGGFPTDLTANGEITYWSPSLNMGGSGGTSDVTSTGSGTVVLPFNVPQNFFPPNGSGASDFNGFQAATLTGTLDLPAAELVSFSIGADDMAFAYLDGQVVCDLGGVHSATAGTCVTPFTVAAGTHSLEVFFVDINNVQSGLSFDVTTADVVVGPSGPSVPEPSTLAVLASALAGLWLLGRRARS